MPGKHKNPHFAIRVPRDLLEKFKYIAEYNARSANREIELLLRQHVANFEDVHGTIELPLADPGLDEYK